MKRGAAPAKINLALVVGPRRANGRHELLTVYQRIALADRIAVSRSAQLRVDGFPDDTLVRDALRCVADGDETSFTARITKRIPVAGGLGGGSSDAATALALANELREEPFPPEQLDEFAARLGADVPFFLRDGPQLGSADGTTLDALDLPQDYWVLLVLPAGVQKRSTADVYSSFDARKGERGYTRRRAVLLESLAAVTRPRDLALLPRTTLPRHRSPKSWSGWARFAPTSVVRARSSTACFCTPIEPVQRSSGSRPEGALGSRHQRGTVEKWLTASR